MKHFYPHMDENRLLEYLRGYGSTGEREAVQKWVASDPRNRKRLDQLETLWLETGRLDPPPVAVDVEAAWRKISSRIDHAGTEGGTPRTRLISLPVTRYAMAAAALILLSFGLFLAVRIVVLPGRTIEISSANSLVRDTLPDGTRVTLNRDSRLSYPKRFTKGIRKVAMTGEIFFQVTHDASRPFLVEAGRAGIRVLGTAFDVKETKGGTVEVSVSEGRVLLYSLDPQTHDTLSVVLGAGEQGILRTGQRAPEKITSGGLLDLYWFDKTIVFRQTRLSDVLDWIRSRYGCSVRVSDPGILECRISVSFRNESADHIMQVIGETFGLSVRKEAGVYIMEGHGCK